MIQEKRGMLKVWNVLLVVLAFCLALFGTFLTRSGIVSSIHSFTQSPLGPWFLGFIFLITGGALLLVVSRLPLLRSKTRMESLVSREATFLYNNLLLVALTLTILVFPYVVITAREAIRAVPQSIRDAALAMGATKWQAIRRQVLPAAAPGLLTASILAAARTIGETAPLIVIGAVVLQTFLPYGPDSPFVALPVQIYAYIDLPGPEWQGVSAAGMIVLLLILFAFNAVAIVGRNRMQRMRW